MRISNEFDGNGDGDELLVVVVVVVFVRVEASLADRDSVKHEATRCMESPRGVTTLLRW